MLQSAKWLQSTADSCSFKGVQELACSRTEPFHRWTGQVSINFSINFSIDFSIYSGIRTLFISLGLRFWNMCKMWSTWRSRYDVDSCGLMWSGFCHGSASQTLFIGKWCLSSVSINKHTDMYKGKSWPKPTTAAGWEPPQNLLRTSARFST